MNRIEKCQKIKWNFLKHIIVRLDINKFDDAIFASVLNDIKGYLAPKNFERFEVKENKELTVPLLKNDGIVNSEIKTLQKIYIFTNDSIGVSINLTNTYIVINVNSENYIPFNNYFSYLLDIINIFIKHEKYIEFKRLGIRKQNICLIKNYNLIDRYFVNNPLVLFGDSRNILSTSKNVFISDFYKINLIKEIVEGKLEDDLVYKYLIDIDAYSDNHSEIRNILDNKAIDMNYTIFDLFMSSINENFYSKLCEEHFDEPEIIGVESNE